MTEEDSILSSIEADDLDELLDMEDLETFILSHPEDSNLNYFQIAVINNSFKIVKYFIEEYPELFLSLDENGNTFVHLCVIDESCKLEMLQFFIDKFGAPILACKNFEGLQPLHYAVIHECFNGTKNLLELLLENDMEATITNDENIYSTSPEGFIENNDELQKLFKNEDPKTKQIQNLKRSLDQKSKEIDEINQNLTKMEKEKQNLENQNQTLEKEKNNLEIQNQTLEKEKQSIKTQINEINNNFTKFERDKQISENNLRQNLENVTKENKELMDLNSRLEQENNNLKAINQELRAELNSGCCHSSNKRNDKGLIDQNLIDEKEEKENANRRRKKPAKNGSYQSFDDDEVPLGSTQQNGGSSCLLI